MPGNEQVYGRQHVQRLQDILDSYGGTAGHPLAAKSYDEFAGKQQKLSAFFKKPPQAPGSSVSTSAPSDLPPSLTSSIPSADGHKRPAGSDGQEGQGPRKRMLFSSGPESGFSQLMSPGDPSVQQSIVPASPTSVFSQLGTIPKPFNKPGSKSATGRSAQDKGRLKRPAGAKESSQQTVLSFFSTSSKKTSDSAFNTTTLDTPTSCQSTDGVTVSGSQSSLPSRLQESTTTTSSTSVEAATSTPSASFSPGDYADWIPGPGDALPFSVNGEATMAKWQSLFQPREIPKCRFHGVPCTEFTVNKKGPNKGRRFFLCSL